MKLLSRFLSMFGTQPAESKTACVHKKSRLDRAMVRLVANGEITQVEIGGNCPSKDIQRLRKAGFLMALGATDAERWETNAKTGCKYKVYQWSGKVPANWVKSDAYTGRERRKTKRGCA
ncbi:hypothetical protein U8C35_06365 [Sinorhizobium medicae]|uniref:hypothetical protein n=1 Tax=Sinorhizobium medicae TaxID=110321 RepID=UPI002AF6CBE7|nr:hypothetical protein [Sinorhizobium medicae]WQO60056.1 hypothetical protein U8C35_06365 [Sinorhizobium medicae]